ncbi:uncharacterized protein LOC122537863 [Frieseomelitta varia]|uniref:uncharacterized protein LOC122537863 n=1 Tax=Frieseomelitta varia TaxID=561572 RepID=UPI001CB67AB2|nr:uncharacterized protein LOC122537863 [Frieseomelitta varia]
MSEKLAADHTNSIALKKHKLLLNKNDPRNCYSYSKAYRLAILFIVICCIFLIYWIILAPLLISAFTAHHSGKTESWSVGWLVLYWFIAFFIWLFIMLCFLLIWKCYEIKRNNDVQLQSYGTNDSLKSRILINTKLDHSQVIKLKDTKYGTALNDSVSDKEKSSANLNESQHNKTRKHKDLPPLVIHRRNSGKNVEHVGTVNIEKNVDKDDKDEDILKSGNDILKNQRESVTDYLKLVTITPQDELDTGSPKGSLSPRELFFIDLIREAEKAERNRERNSLKTEENQFFPSNFSQIRKDRKEEQKLNDVLTNKEQKVTYFIADIKSLKKEKSEVYLKIESDQESAKEWSVHLNNEKPILILQDSSKNEEDENTKK